MDHYICKGTCGAVSEYAGTCSAETCTHKGEALEMCDCGDMSSHQQDGMAGSDDDTTPPDSV